MSIAIHSQLRCHRRAVVLALVVLTVATVALSAHSALMNPDASHVGEAAAICLLVAGTVAVAAGGVAVARSSAPSRARAVLDAACGTADAHTAPLPARAGAPPPVLQVFRL